MLIVVVCSSGHDVTVAVGRAEVYSLPSPKGGSSMSTQATAQPAQNDPTKVDAKHYTVELETEQVRVLRAKYGPGEKSEMHAHPALIGVMVTDGHIRMYYPDGRTEEIT